MSTDSAHPLRFALALAASLLIAPPSRTQDASAEAPIRGFVYVEPFEVRQEFVLRLAAIADRIEAIAAPAELDDASRRAVLTAVESLLGDACAIAADGERLAFTFDHAEFVQLDPKDGPVEDARDVIPSDDAIVAAVLVCERSGFAKRLDVTWDLFPGDEDASEVPVVFEASSPTSSESATLAFSRAAATRAWSVPESVGRAPSLLRIADVREDDRTLPFALGAAFLLLGVGLVALGSRRPQGKRVGLAAAGVLAIVLGGGSLYGVVTDPATGKVSETEARGIVESLLKNVYHAFAYRSESAIFDTLAESVDGPLLEQLYLDIRRGLDVEESGGPRVKVLNVSVVECELQRATSGGLKAGVIWVSAGTVSHYGHVHDRRNQYRGELRIQAVDGRWKVTDVNILEEERT